MTAAGQLTSWWWPLPAWMLESSAVWFVALNVLVCAIAVLSSRAQPSSSPRSDGGVARRASSAALQRLRSSFIFSFPSASFYTTTPFWTPAVPAPQPDDDTDEPQAPTPRKPPSTPALVETPALASQPSTEKEEEEVEEEDANSMSMEEAYALALAGRHRPPPTEEEASRAEVDAKAEEFTSGFEDDLRQKRLDSIFNYTQMLKQRAAAYAAARRQPAAAQP